MSSLSQPAVASAEARWRWDGLPRLRRAGRLGCTMGFGRRMAARHQLPPIMRCQVFKSGTRRYGLLTLVSAIVAREAAP